MQRDGVAAEALGVIEGLVGLMEQVVEAVGHGPWVPAMPTLSVIAIAIATPRASPAGGFAGAASPWRKRPARVTADSGGQLGATIRNSSPA